MKVVIMAATEQEVSMLRRPMENLIKKSNIQISYCISGVGLLASCYSLSAFIFEEKPAIIVQVGIAGTFDTDVELGAVVVVKDDLLGDMGVEENGRFNDVFDLKLAAKDGAPFLNKMLVNPYLKSLNFTNLQMVSAITINEITTRPERIMELKQKFQAKIETMEGAALHYVCLKTETPFIQIRAISNYVGDRDKRNWAFEKAFNNLKEAVLSYAEMLVLAKF